MDELLSISEKIYKQSIVLSFVASPKFEYNLILLGLSHIPFKHGIYQVTKAHEK